MAIKVCVDRPTIDERKHEAVGSRRFGIREVAHMRSSIVCVVEFLSVIMEKYSDFLKLSARPSSNADKNYQNMMKLRDLTNRIVLEKFIFLNK